MVAKKPRIVIVGAGMAGLTAANKLYTSPGSEALFELIVVEGGTRIGGRINTSEFGGNRIEMGATWIHGIGGSPIHKMAQEILSLESEQPWEYMDGFLDDPLTVAEGGYELDPSSHVKPICNFFNKLMDFAQGKATQQEAALVTNGVIKSGRALSVGEFLRTGLEQYWGNSIKSDEEKLKGYGNWTRKMVEEAVFAMQENTQRTYTSANDLSKLDYAAESEYVMFPGEEITIAKGYSSIIEHIASALPPGTIQLGRKVTKIEWQNGDSHHLHFRPVKIHFSDGSAMEADHVIVTVSLGVLKALTRDGSSSSSGMFDPPLPDFKKQAISRLGFGVVNKLFLQLESQKFDKFPFVQMGFHRPDSEHKSPEIPGWMRRTASVCPIYGKSSVVISWFAGEEAIELETLSDEDIIDGVSTTINTFMPNPHGTNPSHEMCNGKVMNSVIRFDGKEFNISKVLKSQWGSDPLFLGSYSYVAVGSSGDDLDTMAMPLPKTNTNISNAATSYCPPLQILFAGEATHRTHYSTTHGAYFSGLREANRLLQHYSCNGV